MNNKSPLLQAYLNLQKAREMLELDLNDNSSLDNNILDIMDDIWGKLSDEEINWLNSRP